MKKVAILLEEQYEVLEAWYPYLRLVEAGFRPVFVGSGTVSVYKSKEGYPAKTETSINDIAPDEFNGVIVPGGFAPDKLRRYEKINLFVNRIFSQGKPTAAICHGGSVLVSARVLKGKKATCSPAIKDDIINAGAFYTEADVVVDGNLITSRKPDDLPAFCREFITFLNHNR